jgi:plastocyanin
MPQPFNWKDSDIRVGDTINFVHAAGQTGNYNDVYNYLTLWSANVHNAARKNTVSLAMHQGFHWEKFRSDASKTARKDDRHRRRAMVLMRVAILNENIQNAQNTVAAIADVNVAWQMGVLVGECARSLMPVPDLTQPSGRMQRRGFRTPNTRMLPFFADQDTLYAHFRVHVMPTIADVTTRAVYAAALRTVGNPVWRPGDSNPAGKVRFDQFVRNDDGQQLEFNCWEALLFWACKANAFTVEACKAMYDDYDIHNRSANIQHVFGIQTAFDPATAQPGDILTWVNGGTLNHVALYMGLGPAPGLTPYILHHLALDEDQDHLGGGEGTVHFRTAARMLVNYASTYGPATCYQNQPFWVATGNTAEYQYAQGLMG